MKHRIVRALRPGVLALTAIATSGCSGYVLRAATEAVATEITPGNESVIARLESSANPTGQGVLVFVRASGCTPRYAWLWVNDNIPVYALDSASQRLTPRLQTVSDASPEMWRRIGSEPKPYPVEVRAAVCVPAR